MSLASGDLTTLPTAQAYLDSPPSAAVLGPLISRVSRAITNHLNRPFLLPRSYTQYFDGTGTTQLVLPNWPLLSLTSLVASGVAFNPAPQLGPTNAAAIPYGFRVPPWDGTLPGDPPVVELTGGAYYFPGKQNVVVGYSAGYQVTNEAQVVPATPFQITPLTPFGVWASDQGVTYANGTALVAVPSGPTVGQYIPPNPNATPTPILYYTFAAADVGQHVLLSYGFIPGDLEEVCLEIVQERAVYRKRPGVRSQSLASQESMSYYIGGFTDWELQTMQPYVNVIPPAMGGLI